MSYEIGEDDDYLIGDDEDALYGEDLGIYDELLGDDDDDDDILGALDMVGARRRRRRGRGRARRGRGRGRATRAAIARKIVQQSQIVKTKEPLRSREWVLGFDSVTTIAAAATADVTSRPQVVFRPDRVVIAGTVAASFLLNDIRVGKNSQFTSGTAVPAEAFSQGAFGVRLKMDTAQISQDVVLRVTNISGGALRFNGAMIGPAVE